MDFMSILCIIANFCQCLGDLLPDKVPLSTKKKTILDILIYFFCNVYSHKKVKSSRTQLTQMRTCFSFYWNIKHDMHNPDKSKLKNLLSFHWNLIITLNKQKRNFFEFDLKIKHCPFSSLAHVSETW